MQVVKLKKPKILVMFGDVGIFYTSLLLYIHREVGRIRSLASDPSWDESDHNVEQVYLPTLTCSRTSLVVFNPYLGIIFLYNCDLNVIFLWSTRGSYGPRYNIC